MVNSEGQFYTMEGIAAAVLMVITASLVMSTTTIYTPGDTHIQDMQLEQLGNDALKIMDTPPAVGMNSTLEELIRNWDTAGFNAAFTPLISSSSSRAQNLFYEASITYLNRSGVVKNTYFTRHSRQLLEQTNAVRVTRLVFIGAGDSGIAAHLGSQEFSKNRNQTVLLEVLIWRE